MENPRLTASGFIKQGTKFGPFHGSITKATKEESQFVDQKGEDYRLTLDKSKTPANQAWLAQLQSASNGQFNLMIYNEDTRLWCEAVKNIEEGQPLTALYEPYKMQEGSQLVGLKQRVCVCHFCHIHFRNPANLQVHIQHYCQKADVSPQGHTDLLQKPNENTTEFVCQLCRSTFSNHSNCETHMIKLHGEPESNLCKFCTYIASNVQTLTAHMFQQHVLVYSSTTKPVDTSDKDTNKTELSNNTVSNIHVVQDNVNSSSSSNTKNVFQCKTCVFKTNSEVNLEHHECHNVNKSPEHQINIKDKMSEDVVSSTTKTSTLVGVPPPSVLSCSECNITFKSIRNFTAHKTYYCANRQFANDLYIAKLQKRQRASTSDEEQPITKRSRFNTSPEPETTPKVISIAQSGPSPLPMLCLSRPTSKSPDSGHHDKIEKEQENSVVSQEKPLDLSVKKCPSTDNELSSTAVTLVRPTSLNVQTPPPRAIVLGYRCIECDILFHKHESLKVHKQYYCATRHQPSPQRASPSRSSPRNGTLSRNSSQSPDSPGLITEKDDMSGKVSPVGSIHSERPKLSPSSAERPCSSPPNGTPISSAFTGTRGQCANTLSSPRQADRGSPGSATSPISSELGIPTDSAEDGQQNSLVLKCQTTPYNDTMITSKDTQSTLSTGGIGQRKIYCVCGAIFRNYDIYVAHKENYCSYRSMASTSPVLNTAIGQQDTENNNDDKTNQNETIICNICQNTFSGFSDLKNHNCVSCVCPACPFVGSNISQLQEHFVNHPGLLLDSSNCLQAESKGHVAIPQPLKITREGAKRRKSTTPHAVYAKQAKLEEVGDKKQIETCKELDLSHGQTRQSVIKNIKPDPDADCSRNRKIINIQTGYKDQKDLKLSKSYSDNENHENHIDNDHSRDGNSTHQNKPDDVPSTNMTDVVTKVEKINSPGQINGSAEEDTNKLKKNNKSNAKLCRTCDLHFNNLSTFIAHRKYYCGASNPATKT